MRPATSVIIRAFLRADLGISPNVVSLPAIEPAIGGRARRSTRVPLQAEVRSMEHIQQKRPGIAALVALALALVAVAPAAASSTISVSMSERGSYSCLGPCATATYFNVSGVAHTDAFGTMTYVTQGTVLDYDPDTNCLDQSEVWALTAQNGHGGKDTLWLTTTSDTFCFTADANVSNESATFAISGGTGRFANATGTGTLSETVLTHPQVGSGTLTLSITF
jgi:hypothetical protein